MHKYLAKLLLDLDPQKPRARNICCCSKVHCKVVRLAIPKRNAPSWGEGGRDDLATLTDGRRGRMGPSRQRLRKTKQ